MSLLMANYGILAEQVIFEKFVAWNEKNCCFVVTIIIPAQNKTSQSIKGVLHVLYTL